MQPDISSLTNAVRIERLSDDEDVDITDDSSNDGVQEEIQSDTHKDMPDCELQEENGPVSPPTELLNPLSQSETTVSDGPTDSDTNENAGMSQIRINSEPEEESVNILSKTGSPEKHSLSEEENSDRAGVLYCITIINMLFHYHHN